MISTKMDLRESRYEEQDWIHFNQLQDLGNKVIHFHDILSISNYLSTCYLVEMGSIYGDSVYVSTTIDIVFPCFQSGLLPNCGTNKTQNNLIILFI